MGGRGASWSGTYFRAGGRKKSGRFYQIKKFTSMPLNEFEREIKDKPFEYLGVVDENNKIIFAGTSYRKGECAVPDLRGTKAVGITHNHPLESDRMIGATFSSDDVLTMSTFKHKFVRAVAAGPNEDTYMLRAKKGKRQNYKKLAEYAAKADSDMDKIASEALTKAYSKAIKRGKKIPEKRHSQIRLGSIKKFWKSDEVKNAGFEYIEAKRPHW